MGRLPHDETNPVVKVVYGYANGSEYFVEGEALKAYFENIKEASAIYFVHGLPFKEVDWKRYDKNSPSISGKSQTEDRTPGESA